MIEVALLIAMCGISAALALNLYRLAAGPRVLDRVLALDTVTMNAIALIVVLGLWFDTTMYFEAAMLFAMVGFISTVAFCKFRLRGNIIE